MKRSLKEGTNDINYYDLYSDYGLALGEHPKTEDEEVNQLSVAILPDVYKRQVLITTVAIVATIAFCGCPAERSTAFRPK